MILMEMQDQKFSISTDASNKGNVKMFPLIVRYFTREKGVRTALLSFFNLEKEDAQTIATALLENIQKEGLNIQNLTSYGADNAPVNFGKNNSVFTALEKREHCADWM